MSKLQVSFVNKAPDLMPHSQCSLRENPMFWQNVWSKNNRLKEEYYFCLISAIVIQVWDSKVKTILCLDSPLLSPNDSPTRTLKRVQIIRMPAFLTILF
jgi:hypothetical protein